MTTTTTRTGTRLVPGALVRLALDERPRSYGVVVADATTRPADGTLMVPVRFYDDRGAAEEVAAEVAYEAAYGNPTNRGPSLSLAACTLVALCEHHDTYRDEWGAACSEPDVPTWIDVPCHADAIHSAAVLDEDGGKWVWNLCPDHDVPNEW